MSSASCCSSSSNSEVVPSLAPERGILLEDLSPLPRCKACSSRWMAASCWRKKNSFCCFDSDSSTAFEILFVTSDMDASLMNIVVASWSRSVASGVDRIAKGEGISKAPQGIPQTPTKAWRRRRWKSSQQMKYRVLAQRPCQIEELALV